MGAPGRPTTSVTPSPDEVVEIFLDEKAPAGIAPSSILSHARRWRSYRSYAFTETHRQIGHTLLALADRVEHVGQCDHDNSAARWHKR